MNAFQLLKADHEKVAQLFERLESASGKAKLGVFDQIKTELELHAHIEEKIFYPALEEPAQTRDLTAEAYEEHATVKKLLRELSRARTADDEWEILAKTLQENVEHHVEEEENELFSKASEVLEEEEIEELGQQMEAEKARSQGGARKSAKKGGTKKASKKSGAAKKGGTKKASKKSGAAKKGGKKSSGKKAAKKSSGKKGASKGSKKSGGSKSGKRSTKKSGKKGRR